MSECPWAASRTGSYSLRQAAGLSAAWGGSGLLELSFLFGRRAGFGVGAVASITWEGTVCSMFTVR